MKLLAISIHGHELVRTQIQGSQIIVGRSPVCDVILRAPKINPVHFMLEKLDLGEGVEEWSVFIISPTEKGHEKKIADLAIGSGLVLGDKPLKIGDVEFRWVEDVLTATPLHGGALKDHLLSIQKSGQDKSYSNSEYGSKITNSYLMELITVNGETDSVSQVNHFKLRSKNANFSPLISDPRLKISWHLDAGMDMAKIDGPSEIEIKKIISKDFQNSSYASGLSFSRGELVYVKKNEMNYYFRFVPQIDVPKIDHQVWADPFYRNWLISLILFALFLFWIKSQPPFVEPIDANKIRVAEIKVAPPQQLPDPVDLVKPEPLPEIKPELKTPIPEVVKKEEIQDLEKPIKKVPPKKVAAEGKDLGKPKFGKEEGSPKKITEVGLFAGGGLFKNKSTAIKADNVKLSGGGTPLASATGTVIVNKAPGVDLGLAGDIVGKGTGSGVGKDLKGLKSDLNFKDKSEVGKGSIGGTFKEGDFSIGVGGSASSDFPGEAGDNEDVQGGLDKESIRRTLANYKRDIRTCYEKALATQSKIGGRIVYKWGISPQGKTSFVELTKTSVIVPTLEVCVKNVIKDIQWPQAANGQSTIVTYPFQFQSKK
ncbi:MAG TPA: AgmX/PglI C-terminal domain-containing protein [Pseudobdellovibrionaceae bacterium]|nr:AgmX/PglI C-terminal domain-containing protein [Pseudobdellovibrionaceae bacterium]